MFSGMTDNNYLKTHHKKLFRVSNHVQFKSGCTTADGHRLVILDLGSKQIIQCTCRLLKTKALISWVVAIADMRLGFHLFKRKVFL